MSSVTDTVLDLSKRHAEHEQLILLCATSVLWLEPQNPDAAELVTHYRDRGYPFDALRETALQLFLIAGFQVSLEAAFQIESVYGHGMSDDEGEASDQRLSDLLNRGWELQAAVYRGNVEKLRENLERLSPQLSRWTVSIGYGLVMSRPGLPGHYRELLEVAVLAVQGFSRQLHSHLRGALNLGATLAEVDLVVDVVKLVCDKDRHARALRMWQMVRHSYCQNGIIT